MFTSSNVRQRIYEGTDFYSAPDTGNGRVLSVTGDRDEFELTQNTANTQETGTLLGPRKSGLICTLTLASVASGGTIKVTVNKSDGTSTLSVVLTNVGTSIILKSRVVAVSGGVRTYAWHVMFSDA